MNFAAAKEMSPYLEEPKAMPVGTPGKMGYLFLGFELDDDGRSIMRDLGLLLVRKSQQALDAVELCHVLTLIEKNLAICIVDDRVFYNGRRNNIIDFLRYGNSFSKILADSLM